MSRRRIAVLGGAAAAAGALAWTGWAAQSRAAKRLRADEAEIVEAGLAFDAEVEHRFVGTSDGGRIHVVEQGTGPSVVLIHGVTLSSAIFAPLTSLLATSRRVIAIDLRGHGASVAGEDGMSLERQARDVAEVLEELGVEQAVVVGHSMGGMVAQVLLGGDAAQAEGRVGAFIALSTSSGPLPGTRMGRRRAAMANAVAQRSLHRRIRHGSSLFPGEDAATWMTRMSFGSAAEPPAIELARSQTQSLSPTIAAEVIEPLLRFDGSEACARIRVPTTVVVGSRDLLTPPRMARKLARLLPDAELIELSGLGHMVMLEDPDALADIVDDALVALR